MGKQTAGKGFSKGILVVFLLVCVGIGVACFQYYQRLQVTLREESAGYLQEVARRTGSNVDRIIDDNYAALHTLASVFVTMEVDSFAEIRPVVETQRHYWSYQSVMLIDDRGKSYDVDGKETMLDVNPVLRKALLEGQQALSAAQMVDSEESVFFAVPFRMTIDGKNMIALSATYAPATFSRVLNMSSFDGRAYAQVVDSGGAVVIRAAHADAVRTGYNVLSAVAKGTTGADGGAEQMGGDLKSGWPGQLELTLEGERMYLIYTPLEQADWSLVLFVPASAVSARSDLLLQTTLILCGCITLVFAGLLALLMATYRRHREKLERMAFVDDVTGGHTIQRFYLLVAEALSEPNHPPYVLIYSNFEKFKVLNEQFGRRVCDSILCSFNDIVGSMLHGRECMGRYSADNFCILLEFEGEEVLEGRLRAWQMGGERFVTQNRPVWSLPTVEYGAYLIENDAVPFPQIIDRAKLAMRETLRPINGKLRYAIYNDEVRRRIVREKHLEDRMDAALENREFQVYLQPKYRTDSETVGGAEALVRWVTPDEGMIYPDEFIPLFEQNGFIIQMDLFVFEEVCRTLRRWLDEGRQPVRISVNCSRVHLREKHFIRAYRKITEQYNIPQGLLEIELTESVVLQDSELLTQVLHEIHESGFYCSMDDFGSGYSSLNLIQSIPVDVLKLDKIFFHSSVKDDGRMESVVNSIVSMARALNMQTVAEGVEYRSQVEMLQRIGCDFIQGYVFARPMPISDFEALAFMTREEEPV